MNLALHGEAPDSLVIDLSSTNDSLHNRYPLTIPTAFNAKIWENITNLYFESAKTLENEKIQDIYNKAFSFSKKQGKQCATTVIHAILLSDSKSD